jgi:hypothetical protein
MPRLFYQKDEINTIGFNTSELAVHWNWRRGNIKNSVIMCED